MKVNQQVTLYAWVDNRFDPLTGLLFHMQREAFCQGYPVYSSLLVCPKCRQIWGEIYIEGCSIFEPRGVSCEHCDYIGPVGYEWLSTLPGSLLDNPSIFPDGVDWAMLEAMPAELLDREVKLMLKYFKTHPNAFTHLLET